MTAKEYLKQYKSLSAEVIQLEEQLKKLNAASWEYESDGVQGSSKSLPYAKHNITIGGYCQKKSVLREISKLEQVYAGKLENLYAERVKAEKIFDSITDVKARTIIRYRYIDHMEWRDIAAKLNDDDTKDSVRMYVEKFLKKA